MSWWQRKRPTAPAAPPWSGDLFLAPDAASRLGVVIFTRSLEQLEAEGGLCDPTLLRSIAANVTVEAMRIVRPCLPLGEHSVEQLIRTLLVSALVAIVAANKGLAAEIARRERER